MARTHMPAARTLAQTLAQTHAHPHPLARLRHTHTPTSYVPTYTLAHMHAFTPAHPHTCTHACPLAFKSFIKASLN